jgi:hypothetical protein
LIKNAVEIVMVNNKILFKEGELLLEFLNKIPPHYWIDGVYDSWLMSRMISILAVQNRFVLSVQELSISLYKKNYKKFIQFLSDLVNLVRRVNLHALSRDELHDFDMVQREIDSQYLLLTPGIKMSVCILETLLELLASILEQRITLPVAIETHIFHTYLHQSRFSYTFEFSSGNVQRIAAFLLTDSVHLCEQRYGLVCFSVLCGLDYCIGENGIDWNSDAFVLVCKRIADSMEQYLLVSTSIKQKVYSIYGKINFTQYADLEMQLFRIWSRFEFNSLQDYTHIEKILDQSKVDDIPDRVEVIRNSLDFSSESISDTQMTFLTNISDQITEMLMSTVMSSHSLLPWYLLLLLHETDLKDVQLHYQSFFEFIANCLPSRLVDLESSGCIRILENIAVLCLIAEHTKSMDYMDPSIQNQFSTLICSGMMPFDDEILHEAKEWQHTLRHVNRIGVYKELDEYSTILLLKALSILPSNRLSFHTFSFVADQFKASASPLLWRQGKLLLKTFWSKHQSLELFCKYVFNLTFTSKELYECFLEIAGYTPYVESQSYSMNLELVKGNKKDIFDFAVICHTEKEFGFCQPASDYISKLLFRLIKSEYAEQCIPLMWTSLCRLFSHSPNSALHDIQAYLFPLTNENNLMLTAFLSTKFSDQALMQNYEFLLPHIKEYLNHSSTPRLFIERIGRILSDSYNCEPLFFELVKVLVQYSCSTSQTNRGLAISELLQVPQSKYGLILPELAIWSTTNLDSSPKLLQTICQILGKATSEFIESTWSFTLPVIVLSRNTVVLKKVITKGKELQQVDIIKRLVNFSGDIIAYLLVYGQTSDLNFFLELLKPVDSLQNMDVGYVLKTNQLQLLRYLIVYSGDSSDSVGKKVH